MVKGDSAKDMKGSKQSTLMGFFGMPRAGPPPTSATSQPRNPAPSSSSPASTTLRTPSSATGSAPLNTSVARQNGKLNGSSNRARGGSPLKKSMLPADGFSDDDLSPPPSLPAHASNAIASSSKMQPMDVDMEENNGVVVEIAADGSPIVTSRLTKRKVMYVEPDTDESDAEGQPNKGTNGRSKAAARKARKSLKTNSDSDEFQFDDADDLAFAAVAEEYEASVVSGSPRISSSSPSPQRKMAQSRPQSVAIQKRAPNKSRAPWPSTSSPATTSNLNRPGPKPLAQSHGEEIESRRNAGGSRSAGVSEPFLLTDAERRKKEAQDSKRESEQCFDFLLDVRDMEGRRKGVDPDYDRRTILVPQKAKDQFTAFERQFWEIKQYHYDTVLFFQKGKFYELYEDDAVIGHRDFDLKLTDRVKMKMVGVPEQSFDYWAAKFLGAGHKVGKVEQAETMIGMEMRHKATAKKSNEAKTGKSDEPKIVNRELKQVFTNGTIVDGAYLTTDDANHCVAIKELRSDEDGVSSFGICVLDASTGEFNLTVFDDDICRTRLETMFRQIRPKELVHAKGNLSVYSQRLLRNILPASTLWQSFRVGTEFYSSDDTLRHLGEIFETELDPAMSGKPELPDAIVKMLDKPLAIEALGGMLFYLKTLSLDKDLISQKNFNVYDPIREGRNLVLDGQTLGHMEVLVNNEGGVEGSLLELLQRCQTPFGKRLFRIWLTSPLRDVKAISDRLDAVDDLMDNPSFSGQFSQFAKQIPDLERIISRIHAGSVKESDFNKVMTAFVALQSALESLTRIAEAFTSPSVAGLLRSAPDLSPNIDHINSLYTTEKSEKTLAILPTRGADADNDEADAEVERIEDVLKDLLEQAKRTLRTKDLQYWHSAQGGKEIYQLQVPASISVSPRWSKQTSTKAYNRYYTPETLPIIRQLQEARETQNTAKRNFFRHLMAEFDKDRKEWLNAVKVVAELDCLVSLAKASTDLDQPKCRPEFVQSEQAFIDFEELRHPAMCLRSEFIANNVQLGGPQPRTVLLTGPNMAGKSTLLRMTAAAVIMAQLGCYVPAAKARLAPLDRIQTRMGAYDNMFASASTFKVELDECSKILREAGPNSLVILDELGRGTSTYDGMAIAGAVLHHLATHTLPLGFFATHYGSLTDDYTYHPNIRKMHMQTHVDDEQLQVVFLYKLIPGVAESSHGTHVARMAGVPSDVVVRADQVSAEFFQNFKAKLAMRHHSALPLVAHADFAWLIRLVQGEIGETEMGPASAKQQLAMIKRAIGRYEKS